MDRRKSLLNPSTPEGIYNLVLLQTDNKELAEQARTEAEATIKLSQLTQTAME